MKSLILVIGMIFGSLAFAGGPQQPTHDYEGIGYYQPELDASVRWMAAQHHVSADSIKSAYSYYFDFKINFEPQSLVFYFYGPQDTCAVNADDVNNIQGRCETND